MWHIVVYRGTFTSVNSWEFHVFLSHENMTSVYACYVEIPNMERLAKFLQREIS